VLTLALLHEVRVADGSTREQRRGVAPFEGCQVTDSVNDFGILELTEVGEDRTLRCSRGALAIYGLTAEEMAGAPWMLTARIHGDDRQRVVTTVDGALQSGDAFVVAYRIVRPAGDERHVLSTGTVKLNDVGDRWVRIVLVDMTLRARASTTTEGDPASSVTDAGFDAVMLLRVLCDRGGEVRDFEIGEANRRAERLLGSTRDRLIGTPISQLLPPAAAWCVISGLRRVVHTSEPVEDSLADLEPAVNATSLRWRAVRCQRGVLLTLRDTSIERSLSEQIAHAQRMEAVGRLAGGIAHDFNNVLSAVIGFGSMVREVIPPSERAYADICEVLNAADRAAGLTRQLLAFSRKQVLEPQSIDLGGVLTDLERMMSRLIGEDVHVTLNLGVQVDPVWVDVGQIEQVIMNLVVNARDAMPAGGSLTIETRRSHLGPGDISDAPDLTAGDYVELRVSDTGTGMPPEVRERLFEPFFTTKGPGQGTGLGLSTAYGIIKQSGGHIRVDSEVGRGTTFRVYLPCSTPVQRRSTRPPSGMHPPVLHGTETILLVEDDEPVRQLIRRVLLSRGYTVLEAANAGEALLVAEDHSEPIDLLLTDVVMPRVGGVQLARRLRQARPNVAVLCMTGYSQVPLGESELAEMDAPVLRKPVTPEALLLRVREALTAHCQAAPLAWTRPAGPTDVQSPTVVHSDIRGVTGRRAEKTDTKVG
jgi:signal transduction histidine kinase/CheY-like chemotaxis protein